MKSSLADASSRASLRACPHYGCTRRFFWRRKCLGGRRQQTQSATGLELGSHLSRPGQMFLASLGSPAPNMASGGVSLERRSRCHIRSPLRAPPLSDMMTAQRKPQLDVRGFRLQIAGEKNIGCLSQLILAISSLSNSQCCLAGLQEGMPSVMNPLQARS